MMAASGIVLVRESLGRRRWLAWTIGIGLLAMIGMFPLRAALSLSKLDRIGFTARQVAGTVWYGRIGEFQLRRQPLGTHEDRERVGCDAKVKLRSGNDRACGSGGACRPGGPRLRASREAR